MALKGDRFGCVGDRDVGHDAPWLEFGGMWRFSRVVILEPGTKIVCQPDVRLVGKSDALKQVYVLHGLTHPRPAGCAASRCRGSTCAQELGLTNETHTVRLRQGYGGHSPGEGLARRRLG